MIIDFDKDYFNFAKYLSLHAPISFDDAKMLYAIASLNGYTRDQVIYDLIANNGASHLTYRKMFDKKTIQNFNLMYDMHR